MRANLRQTQTIKPNGQNPNVLEEIIVDEIELLNGIIREFEEQVFIHVGKSITLHTQRFHYKWNPKKLCYVLEIQFLTSTKKDRFITDNSKSALLHIAFYKQAFKDALDIIYGK